jgi:hypothetical protein
MTLLDPLEQVVTTSSTSKVLFPNKSLVSLVQGRDALSLHLPHHYAALGKQAALLSMPSLILCIYRGLLTLSRRWRPPRLKRTTSMSGELLIGKCNEYWSSDAS